MNAYYKKRIHWTFAALELSCVVLASAFAQSIAAQQPAPSSVFQPVPELPYKVVPNFFESRAGLGLGEASGVALNSKGHVFLFQRVKPMLAEFDERGKYLRSIGEGLFDHPHGLRIDSEDNILSRREGAHSLSRYLGGATVLIVVGRLLLVDLSSLETIWRVLLFLVCGAVFLYTGYRMQPRPVHSQ